MVDERKQKHLLIRYTRKNITDKDETNVTDEDETNVTDEDEQYTTLVLSSFHHDIFLYMSFRKLYY